MRDYFIKLWRYTEWANILIIDALEASPEPDGMRLINHIIGANVVWLRRFEDSLSMEWALFDDQPIAACREANARIIGEWIRFLERRDAASQQEVMHYTTMSGDPYDHPLDDLIAHVINHNTHHRAQIARALRISGATPPATDYLFYMRR